MGEEAEGMARRHGMEGERGEETEKKDGRKETEETKGTEGGWSVECQRPLAEWCWRVDELP